MTEFKEVAHLYLGCDWQWTQYSGEHETGIYGTSLFNSFLLREISLGNGVAKPIIRPLSSITPEEDKECHNIMLGEFSEKVKKQNI